MCVPYNNTLKILMANNTVVNVILQFSWLLVGACSGAHASLGIQKNCNLSAFFQAITAATELCTQLWYSSFQAMPSYFKPFPSTHKPFPANYNSFQPILAMLSIVQPFQNIYSHFKQFSDVSSHFYGNQ